MSQVQGQSRKSNLWVKISEVPGQLQVPVMHLSKDQGLKHSLSFSVTPK